MYVSLKYAHLAKHSTALLASSKQSYTHCYVHQFVWILLMGKPLASLHLFGWTFRKWDVFIQLLCDNFNTNMDAKYNLTISYEKVNPFSSAWKMFWTCACPRPSPKLGIHAINLWHFCKVIDVASLGIMLYVAWPLATTASCAFWPWSGFSIKWTGSVELEYLEQFFNSVCF